MQILPEKGGRTHSGHFYDYTTNQVFKIIYIFIFFLIAVPPNSQQARKFKKVQAKKLKNQFHEKNFFFQWKVSKNKFVKCIFDSFILFPSSKIIFWPFWKLQKMDFGETKFREIDLFDFMSFFWPGLFHMFWSTMSWMTEFLNIRTCIQTKGTNLFSQISKKTWKN